jgi:hypothetical protein
VKGVVSGAYVEESLTPNGTTPVTSTASFEKLIAVTKAAAWVGTLTLATTGGTTLLELGPTEYGRQYPQFELLSLPDRTETLNYRFYRQPLELVADNDIPEIPAPHSKILVWDALLQFAAYNSDADPKAVAVWHDNQKIAEAILMETYLEGQTVEATIRRVRHIDEDPAFARIYQPS